MTVGDVIKAMEELGIDRASARVLGLLPLVYVAWADGKVQTAERDVIVRVALQNGWLAGRGEGILDGWLKSAPSPEYVQKGLELLGKLAARQERNGRSNTGPFPARRADSLRSLTRLCAEVARAAGDYFGTDEVVTAEEQAALEDIADALGLDDFGQRDTDVDGPASDSAALPPGPEGHVLVGSMPELARSPLEFLVGLHRHYGDVVRFGVPGHTVVLLARPEHAHHVLVERAKQYPRSAGYRRLADTLGHSVLTTEGEAWRKLRRRAQPAYTQDRVSSAAGVILGETERMLKRWEQCVGEDIDVADEMMKLTLAVTGKLMLSIDLTGEDNEAGRTVGLAIHFASKHLSNPLAGLLPAPERSAFQRAVTTFDELLGGLIAERRREPPAKRDVLDMLLASRDDETGLELRDDQVRNELITFLVAGHETTSVALAWTMYLLSKYPAAARRARAEVSAVLGPSGPRNAGDATRCPFVNMVLDESMRLYPPVFAVSREAAADDLIGGYRIPGGAIVILSPWIIHRLPDVWPNPEGFDPERFAGETTLEHRCAYVPFAGGPHKCMGQPLALLEMRLVVAAVLSRFGLDLAPSFEPGVDSSVSLRPRNGMRMTVRRA